MQHAANPTVTNIALFRASGAALFVLVWEWLITLDDEVELIWPRENRSYLKWLYLFARYFILGMQLFHRSLEMAIRYQFNVSTRLLRIWYCHQVLTAAFSVSTLEIVLMKRVYALYLQRRWLAILLISLLVMEFAVAIIGVGVTISKEHHFMPLDMVNHLPNSFEYFGISGLMVQCFVLGLTLSKYMSGSMKAIPIARRLARDGTLTFLFVTILGLIVVICAFHQISFGVAAYAWLLTIVSASTCRLITNLLRNPQSEFYPTSTNLQFTTILSDRITHETATGSGQQI